MSLFKSIFHAIGSAASAVGQFFVHAWNWVETDGAKIAVGILEDLKIIAANPVTGFLADLLDQLTKSNIPTEILDKLKADLPNATAIALGIQGLPDNHTDQDIIDLEQRILAAFNVMDDKSQFYSVLGAKIIAIIRAHTMPGQKFTFIQLADALQEAYQAYLDAKNADLQAAA